MGSFNRILSLFAQALVVFYQGTLSLFFGGNCRFYPSCSHYSKKCFQEHTFLTAVILTFKRIGKCHPLGKSGYDPVPKSYGESRT